MPEPKDMFYNEFGAPIQYYDERGLPLDDYNGSPVSSATRNEIYYFVKKYDMGSLNKAECITYITQLGVTSNYAEYVLKKINTGITSVDVDKNIAAKEEMAEKTAEETKKVKHKNRINISDNNLGTQMLDKLSRITDDRRLKPLDQFDNVVYSHRMMYSNFSLLIGDTYFMIPPEFIMVSSESNSQSIVTLRQENTQKIKSGYHKRTILIDLVFSSLEQINGHAVDGPEGVYYMDGLRQLLAQFKCTPFLPITNELVNGMYGIFTVALQSITISTMQGFPDVMTAQITLQEVNMLPYIQMPDNYFKYMIDWDLFRYYYQRLLTEDHTYKKLQSLPNNKKHNKFKISIIDESIFTSEKATEYNILQLINDKKIVKTLEDGQTLDTTNYTTWVDSDIDNVFLSSFQCGYSNILTNIQLSDISSPTVQFMGGMDTIYNITFETTDYSVVQAIEQCQMQNNILTRNNRKLSSFGFIKLESELVKFTGASFVMIESVNTNTVPGFPGLYNVQIQCVAYDIGQSEREELHGFKPFPCKEDADPRFPETAKTIEALYPGECGKYINGEFLSGHIHKVQAIDQTLDGLYTKIKQDMYAEWKLRSSVELYPDLRLPTYDEVDEVISKIRKFREKNSLTQLSYKKYPKAPMYSLHGLKTTGTNNIQISYKDNSDKTVVDYMENYDNSYDGYVDPDFYVFYPSSYLSFLQEDENCYEFTPTQSSGGVIKKVITEHADYGIEDIYNNITNSLNTNTKLVEQFVGLALSFVGHTYKRGAEGEISDAKGQCFDCSGLVFYCLKEIGALPKNPTRFAVASIPNTGYFEEVSWEEMQRGDCICKMNGTQHVVIYMGDNQIVHASNSAPYPKGGVKISNLYFDKVKDAVRCFRPKAFIVKNTIVDSATKIVQSTTNIASTVLGGGNDSATQLWYMLKAHGLSDYAVAGIMGNAKAESGIISNNLENSYAKKYGYTDESYTKAVDNGTYSRDKFINDKFGYGLFQFTYWSLKEDLYDEAKKRGVSISDMQLQVDVMVYQLKNTHHIFDKLNNATSVQEASDIFLSDYEFRGDPGAERKKARGANSQVFYNRFSGTVINNIANAITVSNNSSTLLTKVLTKDEFESICRIVMAETKGEGPDSEKAIAQVIYDRLTHPKQKFAGLSHILNSTDQFQPPYEGELNATVENNVKEVFCENKKYWPDWSVWYFLTPKANNATIASRDKSYDRTSPETVGKHTFWGQKTKGSTVKYTITDESGTSNASQNDKTTILEFAIEAITLKSIKTFGQPVFVRTKELMYGENWTPWTSDNGNISKEYLNSPENTFQTAFCDEVQYSGRGRLVRAFPTYLFCILDDDSQWYDGQKLWTNYYVHKSIVDIAVHGTNDMPTETATIIVTNSYHKLDRTQGGLGSYSISNDTEYNAANRWLYKNTGLLIGTGPKLTDKLIKLHQVIYDHAKLREGTRVHLRMGYGSDPLGLAPVMNGHVSDVSLGDQISVVVTSDGHELIQHITSSNENDTNSGWLGLFGLGESQESSNIIADVICERQLWIHRFMTDSFEGSKYSIEHYGLYLNKGAMHSLAKSLYNAGETFVDNSLLSIPVGMITGEDDIIDESIQVGLDASDAVKDFIGIDGDSIGGYILDGVFGTVTGVVGTAASPLTSLGLTAWELGSDVATNVHHTIADTWNGWQEQYDLLKNIYKANYEKEHYIYTEEIAGADGEQNVIFNKYNMTPWDVCQICTQQVPEYIFKSSYHQFDSRVYFGLPGWMEKYRYTIINDEIYEECKTAAQVHFIDSIDCIIDNQVKVTSKFSNTNVKVMYTQGAGLGGSKGVPTQVIHSDDTIDFSKQKTTILDTPICQDVLGPDAVYEFFGYEVARKAARRVGISHLLYGWQQQYQGQLLLLGHPGLKPHDYMMINDTFASLYGVALVREVTHSFNTNTGFTTSVVPGMVGFSTDRDSDMIEVTQNYLALLQCFSRYTMLRKKIRDNYEKNINIVADMELARSKMIELVHYRDNLYTSGTIIDTALDVITVTKVAQVGYDIYKLGYLFYDLAKAGQLLNFFRQSFEGVKAAKGFMNTLKAIKTGTVIVSTSMGGGFGTVISLAIWAAVDILLNDLFEWLENKNVCTLLPLWWEGYPFVSGVKDGTCILLTESNATGTDEGTREGSGAATQLYGDEA